MVHTFSKVFRSRKWAREIGRGSTRVSKSASRHSVVRVVRLGERVLSLYRTTTPVLSWKKAKIWCVATWNVNKI